MKKARSICRSLPNFSYRNQNAESILTSKTGDVRMGISTISKPYEKLIKQIQPISWSGNRWIDHTGKY
jgi:hypothetical protein